MDHEFLKGDGREPPFTPPPEQPLLRWLSLLLTLLALVYAGYRAIEWLNYRPPVAATKPANVVPNTTLEPVPKQAPSSTTSETGTRIVTKCLSNGETSYSDGDCAVGAKTSRVVTKENRNLMDAVRIPIKPPVAEPSAPSAVIAQSAQDLNHAAMKAECAAWDERVKYLDALARQPLDGQTQDWIRGERKKVRDRQARIPCR